MGEVGEGLEPRLSFSQVFSSCWKRGCEFLVTVDAYSEGAVVWPSFGLKISAKSAEIGSVISEEVKSSEELFACLPGWIQHSAATDSLMLNISPEDKHGFCVVVRMKKSLARLSFIRLLSWSILKNSDLHILSPSKESEDFFEQLSSDGAAFVGKGQTDELEWLFFDSDCFQSRYLYASTEDFG
jgi:hypothetical protein